MTTEMWITLGVLCLLVGFLLFTRVATDIAVIGSLVPLTSAARLAGVAVPATQAMIQIARASLGGDLLNAGRRLEAIGIAAGNLDEARRSLEMRAKGDW